MKYILLPFIFVGFLFSPKLSESLFRIISNRNEAAFPAKTLHNSLVSDKLTQLPEPITWIWPSGLVPTPGVGDDGQPVNLGLRFRSTSDGFIKSIRFWKRTGNNGTHIGTLWSNTGTKLREVTFTAETASGWQTATFATPVPIAANTTYVASYFCPLGQYSLQTNYFNANGGTGTYSANPPLSAPADGLYGANGIYAYNNSVSFPSQTAGSANYWVDVQFETSGNGNNNLPPNVTPGPNPVVTLPTNSTSLLASASDTDGNIVAYSWSKISGPAGGTISTPFTVSTSISDLNQGTYIYRLTVTDNLGGVASSEVTVTVNAAVQNSSTWIWPVSIVPSGSNGDDGQSVNLGVRFRSASSGFIKSIRFWKRIGNNGIHIGTLWSNTGTRLGEVTFTSETASGWQTATFPTPIAISANATYIASYFCPMGQYSLQSNYFNPNGGIGTYNSNPPLSAPADGLYGANGIYAYNNSVSFPSQTAGSANYWVDVQFESSGTGSSNQAPVVSAGPSPAITLPVNSVQINATASDPDGTISSYNWSKVAGPAGGIINTPSSQNTTVTGLSQGTHTFRLAVTDNQGASASADVNVMVNPASVSVSTWIWPVSATPAVSFGDDGQPVNLGLRFRSTADGFIKSIRFWKRAGNNGTHIGTLWSNTGTKLGEVTFTAETASGWQTATFATPVPIAANTTYVASYFCPLGQYSLQTNYFNANGGTGTYSANPPLSAPADGLYGANGIYAYNNSVSFPSQTAGSANYWVDVQFETSGNSGGNINGNGGTAAINTSLIPFSDPDITAPFRGAESWHFSNLDQRISNPTESSHIIPLDIYHRSHLSWNELEYEQGAYDWSYVNAIFNDAIINKQRVSIGIMTQRPGQESGPVANGAKMSYPLYLHDLMQNDLNNNRDYISPFENIWVPNYNSNYYLSRFEALLQALSNHINNSSYQGVLYKDALSYIDIRGYGSWGEWHMVGVANSPQDYPAGRQPLSSSLIRIIDAHKNAFPNNPLVSLIAAYDGNRYQNILVPPQVGYHLLTTSNNWGKIGWRMDSYGWTDAYLRSLLEENTVVYNGIRFDTAIMNRYKYAPIVGEGPCGGTTNSGPHPFWAIPRQVKLYHTSLLGNGNFCAEQFSSISARDSVRMAWKLSGYRIIIEGGTMSSPLQTGTPFSITLNWRNTGIAPVYENWDVDFELQNQTNNSVVWTGRSAHRLKFWQPQSNATIVTDNFSLPANFPAGTYRLVVKIKDPTNFRDPFALAIHSRRLDGSYLLKSDIQIYGSGDNTPPSVYAGSDLIINLPTTQANISGQVNDKEGGPVNISWTKLSGPAGGIINSPNTANTFISSLLQGVYLYRLTATDGAGLSSSDDMVIIVNSPQSAASNRYITLTDQSGEPLVAGEDISVYPIPVKKGSPIFIQGLETKTYSLQLVNNLGMTILKTSNKGNYTLATNQLSPGFYYVRVQFADKQLIKRIIVTN